MLGLTERSEVTVYFPCPFLWLRLGLARYHMSCILCLTDVYIVICISIYLSISLSLYIYIYTEAFAVEAFGAQMPC